MNEALILAAMLAGRAKGVGEISVAGVAEHLGESQRGRHIDDGSIYIALRRMAERGYVGMRKGRAELRDGRVSQIGFYKIRPAGEAALQQFAREAKDLLDSPHVTVLTVSHDRARSMR